MALRIGLIGITGRMGKAVVRVAAADSNVTVAAGVVRTASSVCPMSASLSSVAVQTEHLADVIREVDVLIDFSTPEAALRHAPIVCAHQKPWVIGTTGFDSESWACLQQASQQVPLLIAPNMAIGVHLLFHLVQQCAAAIGLECHMDIMETHHRYKQDAPSGTALKMAAEMATAMGKCPDETVFRSQVPPAIPRPVGDIHIHALRTANVIGEHRAVFTRDSETIEIGHQATSRDIYAEGAIKAAKWLVQRPAGRYEMSDVLNLAKTTLTAVHNDFVIS
jgi:4-hydroxy-tetrahydrodipicolinate reductase